LAAALRANDVPVLRLSHDGGHLLLQPPVSVLSGTEVRPRLTTGLTTSFSFQVSLRDGAGRLAKGGARVDVRYELWDELFLVRGVGVDGRRFEASLPSFDRLLAWWRELEVPVVGVRAADRRSRWNVKVGARVIPFSQSEQRDAQRWLSDSVRQRAAVDSGSDPSAADRSTGVLDLLVGTSIQRRALVGYDWNLTFEPARRPEPKP
jgi:hypothetical protein